jgi:eIF-2B alpha/beta/delta-like uncharacterized protein
LLPSVCKPIRERAERLAGDLRNGRVLGSTEAAYRVLEFLRDASRECGDYFRDVLIDLLPKFVEARPTSIVMENLIRRFLAEFIRLNELKGFDEAIDEVPRIIDSIKHDTEIIKQTVAHLGSRRIVDGDVVLTHSYSSTIIGLFKEALKNGTRFSVYVTESRPLGEGKHTAEVLTKLGIDTTLIVDSAVRFVMKKISKVFVSADAVAANGAVVNKVGTSAIALAAKEARVRVYVTAGTYKFGFETVFGELIEGVVLSDPLLIVPKDRLHELAGKVFVREPLFDVTPPEYIDAIITEVGLIAPQAIPIVMKEIYGWPPKYKSIPDLLKEVKA